MALYLDQMNFVWLTTASDTCLVFGIRAKKSTTKWRAARSRDDAYFGNKFFVNILVMTRLIRHRHMYMLNGE